MPAPTYIMPAPVQSFVETPIQGIHSRRTKSRWSEKPIQSVKSDIEPETVNVLEPVKKKNYNDYSDSDSDSDSDSSSSSSSSSDEETDQQYKDRMRRERKSKSSSRRSSRTSQSESQVIRVPTKELAEIAIKAAFDRGQYNVTVIVE
jgi:hypothetical protein